MHRICAPEQRAGAHLKTQQKCRKEFESLAPLRAKEAAAHPAAAPAPPPKTEQLIPEQPKTEEDKPGEK